MKTLKLSRVFLVCALAAQPAFGATKSSTETNVVCTPGNALTQRSNDGLWNEAQQRLGQGIALFDEGKLNLAAEQLKRAVAGSGLSNPLERATAHKFLALYYCATQSSSLCARHFELAIESSSEITFESSELKTPAYTRALQAAQRKVAREKTVAAVDTPRDSAPSATPASANARANQGTNANASASASASANGKGSILLDVRPWAEVRVNNEKPIITPPSKVLTLTPGRHIVVVRNPAGPSFRTELNVPAGGSVELSHRF